MSAPWNNGLPTRMEVGGVEYEIETDYRAILDICAAISDPELTGQEQSAVALEIFYPDIEAMPPVDYQEALDRLLWFLNGGDTPEDRKMPKLVDWEQDFTYIVAPINRVTGQEVRAVEYMHWWTFLLAYYEIGDCTFAQIVRIRDLRARGKPLDKTDQDWYNRNRRLVDFKRKYTEQDEEKFSKWLR